MNDNSNHNNYNQDNVYSAVIKAEPLPPEFTWWIQTAWVMVGRCRLSLMLSYIYNFIHR